MYKVPEGAHIYEKNAEPGSLGRDIALLWAACGYGVQHIDAWEHMRQGAQGKWSFISEAGRRDRKKHTLGEGGRTRMQVIKVGYDQRESLARSAFTTHHAPPDKCREHHP